MTLPRLVQIHSLHSYPAALLNRDEAGLAKRVPFGGVERIRVSSQCLKRHWRMADDAYALARIGPAIGRSVRSRRVWAAEIEQPLLTEGCGKEPVGLVLKAMQNALYGESDKAIHPRSGGRGRRRPAHRALGRCG
jgi:CRISPR system Cascade subunit CasC